VADLPIGMRAICRSYGGRVADGLGTPWQPRQADSAALEATAIPADWWNVTLVDYLVTSSAAASVYLACIAARYIRTRIYRFYSYGEAGLW